MSPPGDKKSSRHYAPPGDKKSSPPDAPKSAKWVPIDRILDHRHTIPGSREVPPKNDRPGAHPYHGPHFDKAAAQDEIWTNRGSKEVWDPFKKHTPVVPGPEYKGRSNTIDRHTPKDPEYTDPYERRPSPWTPRARAEYNAYKDASEGHDKLAAKARETNNIPVGKNWFPKQETRDQIAKGIPVAQKGRFLANLGAQSRKAFEQKYPQAYEEEKIGGHRSEVKTQTEAAENFRKSEAEMNRKLNQWDKEYGHQVRGEPRPVRGPPPKSEKSPKPEKPPKKR